jgi:hypothetical protein
MIRPRVAKPSKADDADAYELATLRDADTCQRCRRNCGPSARDHRQNRLRGNTVPSNLQVLGLRCHQWKTEHPKDAFEQGWAVPSWGVPAEWPARRYESTDRGTLRPVWVLYDDGGGFRVITEEDAMERMTKAGW